MAKVSCILRQWGALLISVYSWARPAILVASECRGVHVISCKEKKKKKTNKKLFDRIVVRLK